MCCRAQLCRYLHQGQGQPAFFVPKQFMGSFPSAWLWLDCAAVQSLLSLFPTFLTPRHLSFPSLTHSQLLHYSPSLLQGLLPIPLPTFAGFSPPGVISGEQCPSCLSQELHSHTTHDPAAPMTHLFPDPLHPSSSMLGVIVNLGVKAGFYGCADSSVLRAELCYANASSSWWQAEGEQTNEPRKDSGAEML